MALPRSRTLLRASAPPYEKPGPVGPDGLEEFLWRLGLTAWLAPARRWAAENGACALAELVENAADLAAALRLGAAQRAQLQCALRLAQALDARHGHGHGHACGLKATAPEFASLRKAMSTPVTQRETARAGTLLLHMAWAPGEGLGRTETDIWDEKEAAAHAAEADAVEFWEKPRKEAWDDWDHYKEPIDPRLLRQRNPTDSELNVKERRLKEIQAQIQEDWGDVTCAPVKNEAFESMRDSFLSNHGASIQRELGRGYKLVPADVAPRVQEKFMAECRQKGAPDYGFHGTRSGNIPSILEQGLKVPGENGVRVENGSAHGVGIYTAMPGNVWLSKNFCDSANMLICGVVDPEAPARPQMETKPAPKPRKTGQHRNHQRPSPVPVQPTPGPVYSTCQVRESDGIRVVGAARVIFKEESVAPLFVAQAAGSVDTFRRLGATSNPSRGGSKGQVYIPETGEVVWDCWEPVRGVHYRRLKRMVVAKERCQERASLRNLKQAEQQW